MEHKTYYFAGGMYHQYGCGLEKLSVEEHFAAIHPQNGIPYLSKNRNGLVHTAEHASLYQLSEDLWEGILVDYRSGGSGHSPERVRLSPELRDKFIRAIHEHLFYE